MALLIAHEGPLREALRAALEGGDPRTAPFDHPDLFDAARGAGAIVYAPAAPADPERMRRVLGACNAPGVTLIVVVRPPGDDFADEERVLRRDGKPYVVLAAAEGSPGLGDGLRRALTDGALQGRVVELAGLSPQPPAEAPGVSPPASALPSRTPSPSKAASPINGPSSAKAPSSSSQPPSASGPPSASDPPSASGPSSRATSPTRRWALPAVAVGLLFGAYALGSTFLQNGCSYAGPGETSSVAR